jgi:hypothetical protein
MCCVLARWPAMCQHTLHAFPLHHACVYLARLRTLDLLCVCQSVQSICGTDAPALPLHPVQVLSGTKTFMWDPAGTYLAQGAAELRQQSPKAKEYDHMQGQLLSRCGEGLGVLQCLQHHQHALQCNAWQHGMCHTVCSIMPAALLSIIPCLQLCTLHIWVQADT